MHLKRLRWRVQGALHNQQPLFHVVMTRDRWGLKVLYRTLSLCYLKADISLGLISKVN